MTSGYDAKRVEPIIEYLGPARNLESLETTDYKSCRVVTRDPGTGAFTAVCGRDGNDTAFIMSRTGAHVFKPADSFLKKQKEDRVEVLTPPDFRATPAELNQLYPGESNEVKCVFREDYDAYQCFNFQYVAAINARTLNIETKAIEHNFQKSQQ